MKAIVVFILLLGFVVLATCDDSEGDEWVDSKHKRERNAHDRRVFRDWMKRHKKKYRSHEEKLKAMEKFFKNKEDIEAHNKLYEQGIVSYKRGLWEHSDMSREDKRKFLRGLKVPPEHDSNRDTRAATTSAHFPPGQHAVNWKDQGLVGPVENQGQCGSCWAFSTAAIVNAVLRKSNITTDLTSPQQLLDCSTYGTQGCNGGWPEYALDYVKENGITDRTTYPYEQYKGICEYTSSERIGTVSEVFNIPTRGNETLLKNIVSTVGPVSIVLCVEESFDNYQSGVYYQEDCCTRHDHAPVLVGYGTSSKHGDYWIVQNSWGTSWGENGFARIARNRGNMCNIAYYAVYAT